MPGRQLASNCFHRPLLLFRCAYSATEDGWTPADFHGRVGGYGACVVLARTAGGALVGGYNPLGFEGCGYFQGSTALQSIVLARTSTAVLVLLCLQSGTALV
jgi:hypothetical protein